MEEHRVPQAAGPQRDGEVREFDFYQNLRERMRSWLKSKEGSTHRWVEYLMWAPDLFHLLCKLSADEEVPVREKAKLAGAIAYFISPIDLMPEAVLGPAGYLDDIAVAAYVLNSIVSNSSPELLRRHWAGDKDILEVIRAVLKVADKMIGGRMWRKLTGRF